MLQTVHVLLLAVLVAIVLQRPVAVVNPAVAKMCRFLPAANERSNKKGALLTEGRFFI